MTGVQISDGGGPSPTGTVNPTATGTGTTPPAPGNSSGGGDGAVPFTNVLAGLSQDNRQFVEKKGWKDFDAILGSHRELEKTLSSRPAAPIVPEKPEAYQFKLPDGLDPKAIGYNDKVAGQFAQWAHQAKLSPDQAQALHNSFVGYVAETAKATSGNQTQAITSRIETAATELHKAWGDPETATFKRSVELSRRAVKNLDPDFKSALTELGAIVVHDGHETVTNAALFKALAKVGQGMFAEDSLYGNFTPSNNPFAKGSEDQTAQTRLISENPELAETLIHAAGAGDRFKFTLQKMRENKSKRTG